MNFALNKYELKAALAIELKTLKTRNKKGLADKANPGKKRTFGPI
jgi:hypothetical protein